MAFIVQVTLIVLLAASKVLIVCSADNKVSTDHAMNLAKYLKTIQHDPNFLPIKNWTKPIDIRFQFLISQLVSLDGAKQEIKISAYLLLSWDEERIVWDSSAFGNISEIKKDSETVWYPRIIIYNGVGDEQEILPPKKIDFLNINENKSFAEYLLRRDFSAACTFDVIRFPNDIQTCEFQMYFMDFGVKPNVLLNNMAIRGFYNPSNEWTLVRDRVEVLNREIRISDLIDPQDITLVVCTLVYRRVYTYYMMNLVVPIILLSFLQILVFFVPTESGNKISLGITILLSFTVFLLLLDNIIPKSVNMPIISIFITTSMCLSASSLFVTSVILHLFHTPIERKMPHLMHAILVKGLGKLMLVAKPPLNSIELVSMDLNDKTTSCSSKSNILEVEQSSDKREHSPLYNPWIAAALAMERLMLLLGFIIMIAMIIGLVVLTFL